MILCRSFAPSTMMGESSITNNFEPLRRRARVSRPGVRETMSFPSQMGGDRRGIRRQRTRLYVGRVARPLLAANTGM